MGTSKINIRPFKPSLKDEKKEGREPFAVLKYGNIEMELDLTLLDTLRITSENTFMTKTISIFSAGIKEIQKEMWFNIEGDLPSNHRDDKTSKFVTDFMRNPLHPNY